MPPALFGFCYFSGMGMWFFLASLDSDPPMYASRAAGMTGVCHHTQLFLG
jgi:hypothetical protein